MRHYPLLAKHPLKPQVSPFVQSRDELVVRVHILSIISSELLIQENPFFEKSGHRSFPLIDQLVEFVLLPQGDVQLLENTLGVGELELDI